MGKGTGSGSGLHDYYGSGAGLICLGPLDELTGIVSDDRLVWPKADLWADGVIGVETTEVRRAANVAYIRTLRPHGLLVGQQCVVIGLGTSALNSASPISVTSVVDAYQFAYSSTGTDIAAVSDDTGRVTKVLGYGAGELRRWGSAVYECVSNHTGVLANAPPNPTFWAVYRLTAAGNPNPSHLQVEGYGDAWWYHGTPTQTLDTVGEQILAAYGHPPYRRQSVLVLKDWLQGRERDSAANIRVRGRRAPNQSLITGPSASLSATGQANPVAVLAELLQDPFSGLGIESERFEATSWQTTAAGLPSSLWMSPLLDQPVTVRELIAELGAYLDLWLRFDAEGRLEVGRFPHSVAGPAFTATTTIDYHDLLEELDVEAPGWGQTVSSVLVRFANADRAWSDDAAVWRSPYNRTVTGHPKDITLDRPWITQPDQAAALAAETGRLEAEPRLRGRAVVRPSKARGLDPQTNAVAELRPGMWFRITHDGLQLTVPARCVSRAIAAPPNDRVTIQWEEERALSPEAYAATSSTGQDPEGVGSERVTLYDLIQPPPSLAARLGATDPAFALSVLAARTDPSVTDLAVWMLESDVSGFMELGSQRTWAIFGTLTQDYGATLPAAGVVPPDDDSDTLRVALHPASLPADVARLGATQTADAINDDTLLGILIRASDRKVIEVVTIRSLTVVSGVYRLRVRRERFGSPRTAFTTGDRIWLLPRESLVTYGHSLFPTYAGTGVTATLRLQTSSLRGQADLADTAACPDIPFQFGDPYAPKVDWLSLKANGVDIASFGSSFTGTDDFDFRLRITDLNGDFTEGRLVARLGGTERELWVRSFPPGASQEVTIPTFSLPTTGEWQVVAVVRDSSGRVAEYPLRPVGGGSPVTLIIGSLSLTQVADPTISVAGGLKWPMVTLTCTTAGATIEYQMVALYGSPGGTWLTYAGGFFVWARTLYVRAVKAGWTTSNTVRRDFG